MTFKQMLLKSAWSTIVQDLLFKVLFFLMLFSALHFNSLFLRLFILSSAAQTFDLRYKKGILSLNFFLPI